MGKSRAVGASIGSYIDFVHAGFIGGTKTLEGAIRMAQAGLKLP